MFGRRYQAVLTLTALAMLGMMHVFFIFVVNPVRLLKASPDAPAHLSDLYPRWIGARELMLHGRDPYSAEVTVEIQRGYWGRELDTNSSDPAGAARFWYPLYVVFLLAPTVTLSFESVRILYVAIGAGVSIASVWLWLSFLGHPRPRLLGIVSSILLVGSLPAVYALHLQQLTLIVAAAIAASLASISAGLFWPAGIMLAVATIKPQNAAAIIGWLLLWSCADWNKRKTLFISFGITMAAMVLGSELLAPGWITEWRDAVSAYSTYTDRAPAHVFLIFKSYLGVVVSVALIISAGLFCWIGRRDSPATDRFRITAALVLAVNLYLNPVWHDYDLIFLLPAVLLVFTWQEQFENLKPFPRAVLIVSGFVLAWQWIGAAVVSAASLASPAWGGAILTIPWHSMLLLPTFALASLFVIAQSRLSTHSK